MLSALLIILSAVSSDAALKAQEVRGVLTKLKDAYDRSERYEKIKDVISEFLKMEKDKYPGNIEIHRIYQDNATDKAAIYEEYKQLVGKNPDKPEYLYLSGRLENDDRVQFEIAKKLVKQYPDFYWGYILAGVNYSNKKNYDKSEVLLLKAIQLDSTNYKAYVSIYNTIIAKGDTSKAIECLIKAYKLDPQNDDVGRALARVNFLMSRARSFLSLEARKNLIDIKRALALTTHSDRYLFNAERNFVDFLYELAVNKMLDSVKIYLPTVERLPHLGPLNLDPVSNIEIAYCWDAVGNKRKADSIFSTILNSDARPVEIAYVISSLPSALPDRYLDKFFAFFTGYFKAKKELTQDDHQTVYSLLGSMPDFIYTQAEKNEQSGGKIVDFMVQIGELTKTEKMRGEAYYHWACIQAKKGHNDSSLVYLKKAIENAYMDKEHILSDPDLGSVRKIEKFKEIIEQLDKNIESYVDNEVDKEMIQEPFQDFQVVNLEGDTLAISSMAKPLLIEFWGIGCGYCELALGVLKQVKSSYPELTVVLINVWQDDIKEVTKYVKQNGYKDFIYFVAPKNTKEQLKITGVPKFFLVDGSGNIRWKGEGYSPYLEKLEVKVYEKVK